MIYDHNVDKSKSTVYFLYKLDILVLGEEEGLDMLLLFVVTFPIQFNHIIDPKSFQTNERKI